MPVVVVTVVVGIFGGTHARIRLEVGGVVVVGSPAGLCMLLQVMVVVMTVAITSSTDSGDELENIFLRLKFLLLENAKKGHLNVQAKEVVLNVYKSEISENPDMLIHDVKGSSYHIGSEDGFVPDAIWAFGSIKSGDYHEEMTKEYFEKKSNIQNWLSSKNIQFDDTMLKIELRTRTVISERSQKQYDDFVVDEMAKPQNKIILCLPPYHCELNPIELIWADVKQYVAARNSKWQQCIKHVSQKIEPKMWVLDNIVDRQMVPFIINVDVNRSSLCDQTELE
nr:unnamed protein product [Callosobruchus chinensis]